jgi:hypothetical protein
MWYSNLAWASPETDFDAAVARMLAASTETRDATFDLSQREYVGGQVHTAEMHVQYQAPNSVFVTWFDAKGETGQRMLWIPGQNGDRMWVDPPYLPVLSLSPENALATRGQRHTVRRMGFAPIADIFEADRARMLARPELRPTVVVLGGRTVGGRSAHCFDATMRKDLEPKLYAARVEVCFDDASGLPTFMRSWDQEDGALREVETYAYDQLKVNVGLAPFDAPTLGF